MNIAQRDVLIYGFGPYAHYRHNVTIDIIEQLKLKSFAQCNIFKTQFSRKMFSQALEEQNPKIIIGLGQDSRARKIRIERKARNWRKGLLTTGRPISKSSPKYRYAPLKVVSDSSSTVTYDAGAYVCNYSMYLMCEYCEKTNAKFAFLHIPVKVDVKKTAGFVANILKGLDNEH